MLASLGRQKLHAKLEWRRCHFTTKTKLREQCEHIGGTSLLIFRIEFLSNQNIFVDGQFNLFN